VELAEKSHTAEETLTINGKTVSFIPGETILDVARRSGIYIPTLCARAYLPHQGVCNILHHAGRTSYGCYHRYR
jgi:[NiFe] hydrogenase diaphorase moiety small subunit